MKKTLRPLILTLGILVSTGISSEVYAQDCNTSNYKVVYAQDCNTLNYTDMSLDSLQKLCAKYGVVVPEGLTAADCLTVKSQTTTPAKTAPIKVAPVKETPAKTAPIKVAPVKETPAKTAPVKETPAKAAPVKETPAKVAPTKTTTSSVLTENNKLEKEVVALVNQERAKLGLAPLKDNSELSNVARIKSGDMVAKNYFSHTSPTYGSPFDMMKKFGITYTAAGENIAMGQPTAASVMTAWMNSPGHKANILSKNFTEIGVGVAKDANGTIYWTQEFIGK
ncbi:MAG: putative YkwD family protein [Clostridium sp.]|jgi:uncharacterized YkwD family protein